MHSDYVQVSRYFSETLKTSAEVWKSTGTSAYVGTSPAVADPRAALTLPLYDRPEAPTSLHSRGRYSERCFDSWNSFLAVIPVGAHSLASARSRRSSPAGRESDRAKANVLNSRICLIGSCSPLGREIVVQGTLDEMSVYSHRDSDGRSVLRY